MDEQARSVGEAGASARREHARRRARRQARTRAKHPRLGGLLLALAQAPRHERSWQSGALGEEEVAAVLEERCGEAVFFLHDRRLPGSRSNIDHLAVASSGIWVIDAKRYRGKVEVRKPLFGQAELRIAGRDRSKLADGLARQVAAVEAAVAGAAPVHGAFCLVEAELPLIGTLSFRGFSLLYRKKLAKRLDASGPLPPERIPKLAASLAESFPAA
jgi:hypothetical protein